MDPFSFKADVEQQAAQEMMDVLHAPIIHKLLPAISRGLRLTCWNLIHAIQVLIQVLVRSLREMDNAARQGRATSRKRLIDNQNP